MSGLQPRVGALLVATEGAALALALYGFDARAQSLAYAACLLLASFPWIVLSFAAIRGRLHVRFAHVAIAAVLLRLLVQGAAPGVLSDDLWRYVWEGRVQLEGFNPFVDSPASLADLGRGDPVWEQVNNREIAAAYPAFGQLFLRALAWLGLGALGFRNAFGALDLAAFFVLAWGLRRGGRDPRLALVHGLCPLSIVEFCVEGHNDALGIFALVLACALGARAAAPRRASAAAYGLAISAKYLPLLLAPFLWRRAGARYVLLSALVVALSFAPFWPGAERVGELFTGLGEYGARWRHNDSVFAALRAATASAQEAMRAAGWDSWIATAHEDRVAKIPLALLFGAGALWIFVRVREVERAFAALLLLLFALTPTLHPWYVCWLLPFLAFAPHAAGFALLATCSFSYHVLARYHHGDGRWVEEPLWKLVEYAPFYLALAWQGWRCMKTSSKADIAAEGEKRSE